jgi:hypothetical protein
MLSIRARLMLFHLLVVRSSRPLISPVDDSETRHSTFLPAFAICEVDELGRGKPRCTSLERWRMSAWILISC